MTFARLLPLCLCAALTSNLLAQEVPKPANPEEPKPIKVGEAAPKFAAKDDTGAEWKSEEKLGKKLTVVYFYPGDMTGGCTRQACGFRDDMAVLKELGVEVVGVSADTVENHQVFKKAHNLPFTLLADTEGKVAKAFGVPFAAGERTFKATVDGKEITLVRLGNISRWTFVIDETGKIVHKDERVAAAEDSKKIIEVVKTLKAGPAAKPAS